MPSSVLPKNMSMSGSPSGHLLLVMYRPFDGVEERFLSQVGVPASPHTLARLTSRALHHLQQTGCC